MEWKNTMVVVLAAMLVLSVFSYAVHAESGKNESDDSNDDDSESDDTLSIKVEANGEIELDDDEDDDGNTTGNSTLGLGIKERMRERNELIKEQRKELREKFKEERKLFRESSEEERKELLEDMREERKQLRENYVETVKQVKETLREQIKDMKELRGQYKEERKGFNDAREEYKKACKGNKDSDECRSAKSELAVEGKDFMGNAADQALNIIERTKTRIQNNPKISDELAADVISQLDVRAAAIVTAKAKIVALTNESTVNETKAAAEELRTAWSEAKVTIKLSEGLLVIVNHQEFMNHLTRMETRFTQARDRLQTAGEDVAQLNSDLNAFHSAIVTAQVSYNQTMTAYVGAMGNVTTEQDANALLKSTREDLRTTKETLKSIQDSVRAIINDIKEIDMGVLEDVAEQVAADSTVNAGVEVEVEGGDE